MNKINTVKEFGDNIRKLRMKKNISQVKLGELCGLHRTYIGMVERGEKNCTIKVVLNLAQALDVEPSELFTKVF